MRRPQRPSFLERTEAHFLKTLPVVHPREPPVTASSATVASRLNASHVCTEITLREYEINRNGKLILSCAEAVEDESSLWKGKEKVEEIPGHGFTRMSTDKSFRFCSRHCSLRFYGTGTDSLGVVPQILGWSLSRAPPGPPPTSATSKEALSKIGLLLTYCSLYRYTIHRDPELPLSRPGEVLPDGIEGRDSAQA